MKYIKLLMLTLIFGSFALTSCDNGFEELNADPNESDAVPSSLLMTDAVFNTANSMYNTFWGGDMGACWSQQWAKVQYNDEARYIPRESVIEGTVWKNMYEDAASDARTMRNLAIVEGNANSEAVAMVIESFAFLTLTDAFGDVPFSEALDPNNFQPKYDKQEDVYNGVLSLLDEAIAKFGSGVVSSNADIIFGGDMSKWKKFASSLKFRALMRISNKRDVSADLKALVSAGNLMSSTADNAGVQYLAVDPNANPVYERVVFTTRGEWKINSVMVDLLATNSDPRLAAYAQKNVDGDYRGKPSGIFDLPSEEYNYENVSPLGEHFLDPELPGYFMTYSELMFLRAEAAQRGLIGGDAKAMYEKAVTASFEDSGVSGAANFLATNGAYDGTLELIATQNWVGLFGQGFEAWTEWRRTGFPALSPALEATSTVPTIPIRYTYPAIEQSVNAASYKAAVAAQGADKLTTAIWWMK